MPYIEIRIREAMPSLNISLPVDVVALCPLSLLSGRPTAPRL